MKKGKEFVALADGASLGNPGPAACGAVIYGPDGRALRKASKFISVTTSNRAEYEAIIFAAEELLKLGARRAKILVDSELVVRQLNGDWRVRSGELLALARRFRGLASNFDGLEVEKVDRKRVAPAHTLAERAIAQIGPPAPKVIHFEEVEPVFCPCGQSRRAITSFDAVGLSVHLTRFVKGKRHYHRGTTEVYVVVEGEGKVELDGKVYEVQPGSVVLIPPGTVHSGSGGFKAVVICYPAFSDEDEFEAGEEK